MDQSGDVIVSVEWGYEAHEISIRSANWKQIIAGKARRLRSRGADGEGRSQWEYWNFAGGPDGELRVEYGTDGGVGWEGKLSEATFTAATEAD